jgi:hypothetical protein
MSNECLPDECLLPPVLRRSLTICPRTLDDQMRMCYLDFSHRSNRDILSFTRSLKTGKFRHPRARQMVAAANYGWLFERRQAFRPEEWVDTIVVAHEYY